MCSTPGFDVKAGYSGVVQVTEFWLRTVPKNFAPKTKQKCSKFVGAYCGQNFTKNVQNFRREAPERKKLTFSGGVPVTPRGQKGGHPLL